MFSPSTHLRTTTTLALLGAGLLALGVAGLAAGDDDDDRHHADGWRAYAADFPPVTDATYAEECGACHLAYQPGLLSATAWTKIMAPAALAAHYGENATLPAETRAAIAAYLTAHAGDHGASQRARAVAAGAETAVRPGENLPRITLTRYFLRKHDEIPPEWVRDNPGVLSFSRCDTCHRDATTGHYRERQIDIPGHGPWRD